MSDEACGNCRFFDPWFRDAEGGRCRRHPPQQIVDDHYSWPEVYAVNWCGEWEARQAEEPPTELGPSQVAYASNRVNFWHSPVPLTVLCDSCYCLVPGAKMAKHAEWHDRPD